MINPGPLSARFLAGFREPTDNPCRFTSGRGVELLDETGRRFLDFSSQYWNVNLGHQHPELLRRLHRALDESLFVNLRFGQPPAGEILAERLVELTEGRFPLVQFMASGSAAVDTAIKLARQITGRPRILSLRQSYHGMIGGSLSATGYDELVEPFGPRDNRHVLVPPPRCSTCPWEMRRTCCGLRCADEVVSLIEREGASFAAVLAEPVISNQVIVPPEDYWPRVTAACQRAGVILIADEVVSGLGRCGDWLGSPGVGMEPDFVALGKGMTGGTVPFAALLHGRRPAEFHGSRMLLHGQTFDGYNLGCAAVLALMDIIVAERLLDRVREMGVLLDASLRELADQLGPGAVTEVRGWGLFRGLEVSPEYVPDARLHPFAISLQRHLAAEGVLLGGLGRVLIFAPPFVVREEEIRGVIHAVERSIRRARKEVS